MSPHEFRQIGAAVLSLWPGSAWPDSTLAAAEALLSDLDAGHVRQAVCDLARGGQPFAPAPGVVYALARSLQDAARLTLPSPDLTREATPEERERARRWMPRIREQLRRVGKPL